MPHHRRATALAALGTVLVTAAVASAIPDGQGVIHTCYVPASGDTPASPLRPVETTAQCAKNEAALSFNQTGRPGAQGAQGPQGSQGPQGPPGPGADVRVETRVFNGELSPRANFSFDEVRPLRVAMQLERGHWSITAKAELFSYVFLGRDDDDVVGSVFVECRLRAGGTSDDSNSVFTPWTWEADPVLMVGTTLLADGEAVVECEPRGGRRRRGLVGVDEVRIVATKVGGVTSVPVPLTPGAGSPPRNQPSRRTYERRLDRAIERAAND